MSGDFGFFDGASRFETLAAVTLSPAGGGANIKGSWTELDASAAFDVDGLLVHQLHFNAILGGGDNYTVMDIGVGAAAAEAVICPDIQGTRISGNNYRGGSSFIPVRIPAGTRISGRYAYGGLGSELNSSLTLIGGQGKAPYGLKATAYGVDSGNSRGTAVAAHASAGTKGSWVQLVASTTYTTKMVLVQPALLSVGVAYAFRLDLAIGAGGSEQIIVPDIGVSLDGVSYSAPVGGLIFPLSIPAGTRIAARTAEDTAGSASLYVSLLSFS